MDIVNRNALTTLTLMAPIVDVQPAYNLLPVIANPDTYGPEATAFTRAKLEECATELRRTAIQIEKRLREADEAGKAKKR